MAKNKNTVSLDEIKKEAISLVSSERSAWEDATAFVTDKVAFNMRNLLRKLRKNYWGVFEKEKDPVSGHKLIWIPLTEIFVDAAVKNSDLDTKDITFRAKVDKYIGLTKLVRSIVLNALTQINFGEKLDRLERDLAIDGTKVWKSLKGFDNFQKKRTLQIAEPDLLNIYIDPTASSIQDAYRFTERALVSEQKVRSMDWWDTTKAKAQAGLPVSDPYANPGERVGTSMFVDVWEMWGKIPKYLLTGNRNDIDEVDGHIVVSGLEGKATPICHLIEENKSGIKPYEEVWYQKVSGRWYGRGVAEKLMWLQLWINTIVNIRISRARVTQLGIFKIKRGSGVTPQSIGKLASNGGILVNDMNDIEQFVMQEASQASYLDEQNIFSLSRQVTSAFEAVTGEKLPGEASATAVSIQSTAASSQFVMIKEGIGMFLDRFLSRHALPIIFSTVTVGDVFNFIGDEKDLLELDETYVNKLIYDAIAEKNKKNIVIDPAQIVKERERALEKLQKIGAQRFVELLEKFDITQFAVEIDITNEKMDKGVILQNLFTALQAAPELRPTILRTAFSLMGLSISDRELQSTTQPTPQNQQTQNPQEVVTNANTMRR